MHAKELMTACLQQQVATRKADAVSAVSAPRSSWPEVLERFDLDHGWRSAESATMEIGVSHERSDSMIMQCVTDNSPPRAPLYRAGSNFR